MKALSELGISNTPWFIDNDEYGDTNEVKCQYNFDGYIHTKTLASTNHHFKSSESDARLIASAPDCYDALQRIVSATEGSVMDFPKWQKDLQKALEDAKVALAKASGEEVAK